MSGEIVSEVFSNDLPEVFDMGLEDHDSVEVDAGSEETESDGGGSDVDRIVMEGWINLWGDDELRKKVVRHGEENTKPEQGYLCRINMVGCLKDGTTFDDYEPLQVQVGDAEVVLGIDVVLVSMDVGEKSLVEVSPMLGYGDMGRVPDVPPSQALIYLLELLSAEPEPDLSTYTIKQLRAIGTRKRERGNWWYARQENIVALGCYDRALDYLGTHDRALDKSDLETEDQLLEDRLKVYNNMAAIHLKMRNYEVALREIDYVVTCQPTNVKALFRKGRILAAQGHNPAALEVLSRAMELAPDNNAVRSEVHAILETMKMESHQVKQLYKKMFGNAGGEKEKPLVAVAATAAPVAEPPAAETTPPTAETTPTTTPTSTTVTHIEKSLGSLKRKNTKPKVQWGLLVVASAAAVGVGFVAYRYRNNLL